MNYGVNQSVTDDHIFCQFMDAYPPFSSNEIIHCEIVLGVIERWLWPGPVSSSTFSHASLKFFLQRFTMANKCNLYYIWQPYGNEFRVVKHLQLSKTLPHHIVPLLERPL